MSGLSACWQATYEQAWAAWCAGTIPIGATVSDSTGALVAAGRNRVFCAEAPAGQVAGTWIAHAEVNALLQLPAGQYADYTVTSTTEPCLLCSGAITMTLRGRVTVRYAVEDPIGGGLDAMRRSPQGQRRELRFERLDHSGFTLFADALNLAESIRRSPEGIVAVTYRRARPDLFACATELERTLSRYVSTNVPLNEVLPKVSDVLRAFPGSETLT